MSKATKTLRVICADEPENSMIASKPMDNPIVLDINGAEIRLTLEKAIRLSRWLHETASTMNEADCPESDEEECV